MFRLTREQVLNAASKAWGDEEEALKKALVKRLVNRSLLNTTINSYIFKAIEDAYPRGSFPTPASGYAPVREKIHTRVPRFIKNLSLGADGEIAVRDFTLVTTFKA